MADAQQERTQSIPVSRYAVLLDGDLFFAVKVADTLRHAGFEVRTLRKVEALADALAERTPDLVCINMAARGVDWQRGIEMAHSEGLAVLAFGPHVDTESQAAARRLGATTVIANSRLSEDLPDIALKTLRRAERRESAGNKHDDSLPSALKVHEESGDV
jgi:DNA-binding NtrC family response regulator